MVMSETMLLSTVAFSLAILTVPTVSLPSIAALPSLVTSCTVPNTAALTFDDGPYIYSQNISDTLTAKGAKGTFFLNGKLNKCIYDTDSMERVRHAYASGHQIASHGWSHTSLPSLSADQVELELSRVDEALKRIAGVVPAFVRPPYGNTNDQVLSITAARGQTAVNWNLDAEDWNGLSAAQTQAKYDAFISRKGSGLIALNHESYDTTAFSVLPYVIDRLQEAGYDLVTVAECLGSTPYKSEGAPGTPDGTWTC